MDSTDLRVAFISEHASPLATIGGVDAGGQNIAVAELATELARSGAQVDIFTRQSDVSQPAIVQWKPRVRVIHVPAGPRQMIVKEKLLPYMDEFAVNMAQFIRFQSRSYQLIHAHFFMSGLVALRLKKELGIPFVITFHALGEVRRLCQGGSDGFPASRTRIEKMVIGGADKVVALCPQDRIDLITLYGAAADSITVIPNGYSATDFFPVERTLARAEIGLGPDEPVILQLGRMVPRKGVDNVIRAVAELKQSYSQRPRLLIVGGESPQPDPVITPEIGRLQTLACDLGVADQVTFTGSRSQQRLRYYYSAADVFVTTPWYEPFGITPLESMACGTPVIGAAVGGIQHTVLPGKTGCLVPPNDPALLAGNLYKLLTDASLRQTMSQAAIQHVRAHYTWARVVRQTISLYESVALSRRWSRPAIRAAIQPVPR